MSEGGVKILYSHNMLSYCHPNEHDEIELAKRNCTPWPSFARRELMHHRIQSTNNLIIIVPFNILKI